MTFQAISKLGFSEDVQRSIMTVLAGVLHLGNISFGDVEETSSVTVGHHLEFVFIFVG